MDCSSIFKPIEPESSFICPGKKKFLHTPLGQKLEYVVSWVNHRLNVYELKLHTLLHSFEFPEGSSIVDVDYFPAIDGSFGLLVAVFDELGVWGSVDYVVGLTSVPSQSKMKIGWSLDVPERITIIKTLFTNEDLASTENTFKLFSRIYGWDHIVAIGAKNSTCYVAQLAPQKSTELNESYVNNIPKNLVNIMATYTQKATKNFVYAIEDLTKTYPVSSVSVTALALLPRSRTLLVGLSMGGIISAALNPSNHMKQLELRHERLIRYLAPLEPEDDPERYEYFIAAADGSPRHPLMIHLWRGCFKSDPSAAEEDPETRYDKPLFYVALEHRFQYSQRWITLETMTHSRYMEGMSSQQNRTRKNNDDSVTRSPNQSSLLNVSQALGASLNRSSVFLAYERIDIISKEPILEAGVFDIDSYYYKRMPGVVGDDRTVLRQCPFLSTIRSNIPAEGVESVGIMLNSPLYFSRFSSTISDADQLFFPSSLNFNRVFLAKSGCLERLKIISIQEKLLDDVSSKLPQVLLNPEIAAGKVLSAGIVPPTVLQASPDSSMNSSLLVPERTSLTNEVKVILNAMLYYQKLEELIGLTSNQLIDDDMKKQIAEWAFYEACDFRKTIVDRTCNLFDGSSKSLSPVADSALSQGAQLFDMVQQLLLKYSEYFNNDATLAKFAVAVKCCSEHTRLVGQFINYGVVPTDIRVERRMKESHESKLKAAAKNKVGLPIQMVVRRLEIHTNGEHFWNGKPHDQWYPPNPCDLLEPILFTKVPEKLKRELIMQYVVDWIRASSIISNETMTDSDIAKQAHRTISDHLLGANSDRILFILEQEKEAITIKDENKTVVFSEKPDTSRNTDSSEGSWADLWSEKVRLTDRLSENDKKKFDQIYRARTEFPAKKLPQLDENEERLYQYYLYTRRKYSEMSAEAIKSNKYLNALLPHLVPKVSKHVVNDKSEKQKEMETAVRNMFERHKNKKMTSEMVVQPMTVFESMKSANDAPTPSVIQKVNELQIGKKRRSVNAHDENNTRKSPPLFVPPSTKRIALTASPLNDKNRENSTSSPSILTSQAKTSEDDVMIHAAIQTPAKYLRRPQQDDEINPHVSPINRPAPSAICPNSILKTAKSVQSPSRGRIRFHESVPRGFDESLQERSSIIPTLNFDDCDEDDENEGLEVSAEISTESEGAENEEEVVPSKNGGNEECMEMEKSWEAEEEQKSAENFDVYEDCSSGIENQNKKSEICEEKQEEEEIEEISISSENGNVRFEPEVVETPVEKTAEISEEPNNGSESPKSPTIEKMDETFEIPEGIEERVNVVERFEEMEEEHEDEVPVSQEEAVEEEEHEEIEMEEENENDDEEMERYHGVTVDIHGVEKSFEIQQESDETPEEADEDAEENMETQHIDMPILAGLETKEVQGELEKSNEKESSPAYSDNVEEEMEIDLVQDEKLDKSEEKEEEYEPPLTRSRCNSRCDSNNLTSEEQKEKELEKITTSKEVTSDAASSKDIPLSSTRKRSKSRSRTTSKNELAAEKDDWMESFNTEALNKSGLAKRTSSRTPKRPPVLESSEEKEDVQEKPKTSTRTTRSRKNSEMSTTKEIETTTTPKKRGASRTPSRSRAAPKEAEETEEVEKQTPKKAKTTRSRASSVTIPTEEEQAPEPKTPRRGRSSKNVEDVTTPKKVAKSISARGSATKATPTRASARKTLSEVTEEEEEPTTAEEPKTPTRSSRRSSSTSSVTRKTAASAKKTLPTIDESKAETKKSVGRPRAASTTATSSSTTSAAAGKTRTNWRDRMEKAFENDPMALEIVKKTRRARTVSATEKATPKKAVALPSDLNDIEEEHVPTTPRRSTRRTPRL